MESSTIWGLVGNSLMVYSQDKPGDDYIQMKYPRPDTSGDQMLEAKDDGTWGEHEDTNEELKEKRQLAFIAEADPLKFDYQELMARFENKESGITKDDVVNSRTVWLNKKQEIRERFVYKELLVTGEDVEEDEDSETAIVSDEE